MNVPAKARWICIYPHEPNDYSSMLKTTLCNYWILLNSLRMHSNFPLLWENTRLMIFNSPQFLLYYIHQVHWQPQPLVFRHAHTCKIPVWAQYSSNWVSHFLFLTFKTFFFFIHYILFLHLQSKGSILDLEILHLEHLWIKICVYIWGTAHSTTFTKEKSLLSCSSYTWGKSDMDDKRSFVTRRSLSSAVKSKV